MATGFVYHELYMWHENGNFAGFMPYGNPVQPFVHSEHRKPSGAYVTCWMSANC